MLEPTHESEPFSRTTPGSQTLLRGLNYCAHSSAARLC
jgi:hypothetical protein